MKVHYLFFSLGAQLDCNLPVGDKLGKTVIIEWLLTLVNSWLELQAMNKLVFFRQNKLFIELLLSNLIFKTFFTHTNFLRFNLGGFQANR